MQQTAKWIYDFSHSKIGFSVRHFGISETDGFFRKFVGSALSEKENFSDLQVELNIDTNSIDTNDSQRDMLELISKDNYKMIGDLTIKGITKTVVLNLEFAGIVPKDPFGNTKAGFFVSGKINRKDWDITWNAALDHGGIAVSETVKISCPIELLKAS